ncbi:MAG: ATP-binding protein [Prevotella sp.]|nr:ATP-binding protein [Prevotella sp.]
MMNNNMILSANEMRKNGADNQLTACFGRPLALLTRYYSEVLERQLTTQQTLHLLNAQLAFLMTVFPATSMVLRVLCLTWFVSAVLKCRLSLRR